MPHHMRLGLLSLPSRAYRLKVFRPDGAKIVSLLKMHQLFEMMWLPCRL